MPVLEQTLAEWSAWYVENRAAEFEVHSASDAEITPETVLLRIFAPPDGRVPKKGYHLKGPTWEVPHEKPKNHLILLCSKGKPPLILAIPKDVGRIENCSTNAQSTQKLSRPFLWRCKVCKKIDESAVTNICCGSRVRQLAPVSDFSRKWFENFSLSASLDFISPSEICSLTNVVQDQEILDRASTAGMELEQILKNQGFKCPEFFEVYNPKTDHIRVSDLKGRKGFVRALSSAVKHRKKNLPAKKTAPFGNMIELGHLMDEFFENILTNIETENWAKGERVHFYCEQFELAVTGSPDLKFRGIPVEMKTTNILPTEDISNRNRSSFRQKWKTNYLPQIAMYSHASSIDWMFLLLISRQTGEFTILPVDGRKKFEQLQKEWSKWVKQKQVQKLLAKYSE